MKKCFAAAAAVLLALLTAVSASAEGYVMKKKPSFYEKIIRYESEYVISLSLGNGVIGFGKPSVTSGLSVATMPEADGVSPEVYSTWPCTRVVPYFSAFAALGLCENAYEGGRDTVLAYINWYISHMNTAQSDVNGVAGTVYDYYCFVDPSDPEHVIEVTYMDALGDKTRNYDSTDSYAATFLKLLCSYTDNYDPDFLNDKAGLVETLVGTIYSTYCADIGLTGAKPDYMVCYLMDNCEVYEGLAAISEKFPEYAEKAEQIRQGIIGALDSGKGYYYPAVFENGSSAYEMGDTASFEYYPQATSQLFPIIFGVTEKDGDMSETLYTLFNSLYGIKGVSGKDWTRIDAGSGYPWALNLRAAVIMEDWERAEDFVESVYTKFVSAGHPYPYYCAEAGHILIAVGELMEKAFDGTGEDSSVSGDADTSVSGSGNGFIKALPYIALAAAVIGGAAAVIFAVRYKPKKK